MYSKDDIIQNSTPNSTCNRGGWFCGCKVIQTIGILEQCTWLVNKKDHVLTSQHKHHGHTLKHHFSTKLFCFINYVQILIFIIGD